MCGNYEKNRTGYGDQNEQTAPQDFRYTGPVDQPADEDYSNAQSGKSGLTAADIEIFNIDDAGVPTSPETETAQDDTQFQLDQNSQLAEAIDVVFLEGSKASIKEAVATIADADDAIEAEATLVNSDFAKVLRKVLKQGVSYAALTAAINYMMFRDAHFAGSDTEVDLSRRITTTVAKWASENEVFEVEE